MTDTVELIARIEEFLGDAEHFELVDGNTVDITPASKALDGLKELLAAQIQYPNREEAQELMKVLRLRAEAAEARVSELENTNANP